MAVNGFTVTVVIPTRNRPELLAATLASVAAQAVAPTEVIVVDDGSDVPLAPETLPRLRPRVVRHEQSLGVAAARNAGIRAAQTEWIALLDDDDLWAPDKLRLQLTVADVTGTSWTYGSAVHVDDHGHQLTVHTAPPAEGIGVALRYANVIPAGSSNVLARRELLIDAGLFDPAFRHFADWDLWIRLARAASPAPIPDPVVGYVRHAGSMQHTEIASARSELAALSRKHGEKLGGVDIDYWLAEGLANSGSHLRAAGALARSAVVRRAPTQARAAAREARHAVLRRPARSASPGTPAPAWARRYADSVAEASAS